MKIQPSRGVIKIKPLNKTPSPSKDLVKIEAITPVEQFNERVKSELQRNEKRKMIAEDVKQSGSGATVVVPRKKRRVIRVDSSGF